MSGESETNNSDVMIRIIQSNEEIVETESMDKVMCSRELDTEARDEFSDDLFSDDADAQDSPCEISNLSQITENSCMTSNTFRTPIQTSKCGLQSGSPAVPNIPMSLIPILSNVNESWTSEFETPQIHIEETRKFGNLADEPSKSFQIVIKDNFFICSLINEPLEGISVDKNITDANSECNNQHTPIDSAITRIEKEEFHVSPVLRSRKCRRRPKRRILESPVVEATSPKLDENVNRAILVNTVSNDEENQKANDNSFSLNSTSKENINSGNIFLDVAFEAFCQQSDIQMENNRITDVVSLDAIPKYNESCHEAIFDINSENFVVNVADQGFWDQTATQVAEKETTRAETSFHDGNFIQPHTSFSTQQNNNHDLGGRNRPIDCETEVKKNDENAGKVETAVNINENSMGINVTSTQNVFGDLTFTSIDQICCDHIESKANEITKIDVNIAEHKTVNNESQSTVNITETMNSSPSFYGCDVESSPSKLSINEPDKSARRLSDRVKDIKRSRKPRQRISEFEKNDIVLEDFTKDVRDLENAKMLPVIHEDKLPMPRQLGFIPFSELCLIENVRSVHKIENVETTGNLHVISSNKEDIEPEQEVEESISTKEVVEQVVSNDGPRENPCNHIMIKVHPDVDDDCILDNEAETQKADCNQVRSSVISEPVMENESVKSLPTTPVKEKNVKKAEDIFQDDCSNDLTDTEMWNLDVADHIEQFSEWIYKPSQKLQKIVHSKKAFEKEMVESPSLTATKHELVSAYRNRTTVDSKICAATNRTNVSEIEMTDGKILPGSSSAMSGKARSSNFLTHDLQCGFSTANEIAIPVEKRKLCTVREEFEECDDMIFNDREDNRSSKNIKISNRLREKVNDLKDELQRKTISEINGKPRNSRSLSTYIQSGFSTAGGKSISVSENKLRMAEKLFEEIDELECKNKEEDTRTSISDKKIISFREERNDETALLEYNSIAKKNPKVHEKALESRASLSKFECGFSTASGKAISVNEDKLRIAEKLYQEIEDLDCKNKEDNTRTNIKGEKKWTNSCEEIENYKTTSIEDTIAEKTPKIHMNALEPSVLFKNFKCGFSTASGKAISVSEDKLRLAEKLYQEIEDLDCKNKQDKTRTNIKEKEKWTNSCEGDQNNKTVTIKDKVAEKTPEVQEKALESRASFTDFECGFTTASGKTISVSEDKLRMAKKLYQEIEDLDFRNKENNCNKTALIKHNSIAEKTPEEDKKATDSRVSFNNLECGFSEATEKTLSVRENKFSIAKKSFEQLDKNDLIHDRKIIKKKSRSWPGTNSVFKTNPQESLFMSNENVYMATTSLGTSNKTTRRNLSLRKSSSTKESLSLRTEKLTVLNEKAHSIDNELMNITETVAPKTGIENSGLKRKHESNTDTNQLLKSHPPKGSTTVTVKSLGDIEKAVKKAKLDFSDISQKTSYSLGFPRKNYCSGKDRENSIENHEIQKVRDESEYCHGFSVAVIETSEILASESQIVLRNEGHLEFFGFSLSDITISEAYAKSATFIFSLLEISVQLLPQSPSQRIKLASEDNIFEPATKRMHIGFSTTVLKPIEIKKDIISQTKTDSEFPQPLTGVSECEPEKFRGFSTASGKLIKINEDALRKAKTIFEADDVSSKNEISNIASFGTANDDNFATDKKDKVQFGRLIKSHREESTDKTCAQSTNRESESTMKRTKELANTAQSLHDNELSKRKSTIDCSTVRSMKVKDWIANNQLQLTNENDKTSVSVVDQCSKADRTSQAISTTNGKKMKISNEALSRARVLFAENRKCANTMGSDNIEIRNQVQFDFFSANDHESELSNEPITKRKCFLASEKNSSLPSSNVQSATSGKITFGFSTASGHKVKVSDEALAKAKCLLAEEYNSDSPSINVQSAASGKVTFGFSTASGHKVKVSDEALEKAKCFFSEERVDDWQEIDGQTGSSEKAAMKSSYTPENRTANTSRTSTPGLKSVLKRRNSDYAENTSSGKPETSNPKKVKFNYELRARKLFDESSDNEEEMEVALPSSTMEQCGLVAFPSNDDYRKIHWSIQSIENENSPGTRMGCEKNNSTNDRSSFPWLQEQKSITELDPLAVDAENAFYSKGTNNNRIMPIISQTDGRTDSDEVRASTEALLADEENTKDSVSWSSGLSCSPTMFPDRQATFESIRIKETEGSTRKLCSSPIIGNQIKFGLRKRRRSRLKGLRDTKLNVIEEEDDNSSCVSNYTERKKDTLINRGRSEDSVEISDVNEGTADNAKISDARGALDSEIKCSFTSAPVSCPSRVLCNNRCMVTSATAITNYKVPYREDVENTRSLNPSGVQLESSRILLDQKNFEEDLKTELCTDELEGVLEARLAAALKQDRIIRAKKRNRPRPVRGTLLLRRKSAKEARASMQQLASGSSPTPYTPQELAERGIAADVVEISSATAASYKFTCARYYSENVILSNTDGLEMSDGARLIVDENGCAGILEFQRSFMASPGVDPALVPLGWIENHYRWIVWKLASIDRMKFGDMVMPRMLNPQRVMEELKYRYDREIDGSERPALRRIMEKDDPACRRVVLCVATVTKLEVKEDTEKTMKTPLTIPWKVELTDGWYSVPAVIDMAMVSHIESGKVCEGTKIVTYGAELLNSDQGCSPLERPADVCLRIHTNSTRRARWYTKLGYQRCSGAIPSTITAIHPNGGQIGKLTTTIARVYPLLYREKTADGQSIFRNAKCEEKAAMVYEQERQAKAEAILSKALIKFETRNQKQSASTSEEEFSEKDSAEILAEQWSQAADQQSFEAGLSGAQRQSLLDHRRRSEEKCRRDLEKQLQQNLPAPRQVSTFLRVRLAEGEKSATLAIWGPSEDLADILKEGCRMSIHNAYASGKRFGELQLTAGRQSFFKREGPEDNTCPRRCLTSLSEVTSTGFSPSFGEFDTIGFVVSIGPAPHGMRNFETAYLAYPSPDSKTSVYLSVLFWGGIAAHGYSDILSVGSAISCSNLEWRRCTQRSIPTAYCSDRTVFTRNPRQSHLRVAFEDLGNQIKDPKSYAAKCAAEIAEEILKKSTFPRSPASGTPSKLVPVSEKNNPGFSPQVQGSSTLGNPTGITPVKSSTQKRLEKLQWYGAPPDLSPIIINHSSVKVTQDFRLPVQKTLDK